MKGEAVPEGGEEALRAAVAMIRRKTSATPEIVLILGSGLGSLADAAEGAEAVETAELPGYPPSTVEGHRGRLVFGRMAGRSVLFVQGRVHLYEGHSVGAVVYPVRLAHALGARSLVVTNAAGGINPSFRPGTLMFITDHLNQVLRNPLAEGGAAAPPRAPGLAEPYDLGWTARAEAAALASGIATRRGVYLWTGGPSYETKAEIRAFARMGADAVGMSTVPETVQARALGMRVLGISTITNPAAGLSPEPLSHEEVLTVGRQMRGELEQLVRMVIGRERA